MNDEQLRKLEHLVNDTRLTKHQIARELGISFNSLLLYMERRDLRIARVLVGPGTRTGEGVGCWVSGVGEGLTAPGASPESCLPTGGSDTPS